jgi:hypothetical protein
LQLPSEAIAGPYNTTSSDDIHLISARPGWVTVRANCRLLTAERLMSFARELSSQMQDDMRDAILISFREIVLNAMEHGAAFNPEQLIEVTAVRTRRSFVFYVHDPGSGFRQEPPGTDRIADPKPTVSSLISPSAISSPISPTTSQSHRQHHRPHPQTRRERLTTRRLRSPSRQRRRRRAPL